MLDWILMLMISLWELKPEAMEDYCCLYCLTGVKIWVLDWYLDLKMLEAFSYVLCLVFLAFSGVLWFIYSDVSFGLFFLKSTSSSLSFVFWLLFS